MKNILVVYGGKSCEHDISVITGCLSKGYFDGNLYSAYFDNKNVCYLVPNNVTPTRHLNFKGRKQACLFPTPRFQNCRMCVNVADKPP